MDLKKLKDRLAVVEMNKNKAESLFIQLSGQESLLKSMIKEESEPKKEDSKKE